MRESPFPHRVIDDFFEPARFARLRATFPDDTFFRRPPFSGGRRDLEKGDPMLDRFLTGAPEWRALYEELTGAGSLDEVFALHETIAAFGGKLDVARARFVDRADFTTTHRLLRRFARDSGLRALARRARRIARPERYYTLFSLGVSRAGYRVPPHTDNRQKCYVVLVYFDELSHGGELVLWRRRDRKPLERCERYPDPAALEEVARIAPRPNRAVIMLNPNNAYHSAEGWSTDEPRRFLYAGVAKADCESMWRTRAFALADSPRRQRWGWLGRRAALGPL